MAEGWEEQSPLLVGYIRIVGGINRVIGEVLSWLALLMVLVCFTVVVQRYVFHYSIVALQDLYVWLNGAMFTGVAGYALLRDEHVRVDIYYRPASLRSKAIRDLIGVVIFLIPFVAVVLAFGIPYVQRSWKLWEGSANVGGMPGLFVLKSFIIVFCIVIGLQGIAMALRSILVLRGQEDLLPAELRYTRHAEHEAAL
ncbi:MAG TPA: TRAP transporter small permease subunit [Devosia sp.]|nr:TRAP transporter small permease subunit [Devosia sp.]